MLEELTAYKTFGSIGQVSLVANAINRYDCQIDDLIVLANYSCPTEIPRVRAAISLLQELGLCTVNGGLVSRTAGLEEICKGQQEASIQIGRILFKRMMDEGIIPFASIQFDYDVGLSYIHRRSIPLKCSQMRNYLIAAGILIWQGNWLYITEENAGALNQAIDSLFDGMTPDQLLKKLEKEKEAGAEAEEFVMKYEQARVGLPMSDRIKQVSLMSVSAGFDIASFNSAHSTQYDRFIEVKAISRDGFFISSNEMKTAKELGNRYHLYLVELSKVGISDYSPFIICDPVKFFGSSTDWRVVPNSFHVSRVF